jgi:arsenite methyltransferase
MNLEETKMTTSVQNTDNPSAEYFDKVAGQWDELRSGYFNAAVREAAIRKAYLHPDMVVADVGAGTGFMASGLAPLVKHVHVLDGSSGMLEVAKKNLAQFGNVEYHLADGLVLPLHADSLEAVFANMYLHHCPDPFAAIQEMVSVLRPGGRLVLTDLDVHDYEWLRTEMADVWLGFDRGQIRKWFEEAGLVNVVVDCTGQSCTSDSAGVAGGHAAISIFVAAGTKRIVAHEMVQASYAAQALGKGCGCGDAKDAAGNVSTGCCSGDAGDVAGNVSTSCCSPGEATLQEIGTVDWNTAYSAEEIAGIPGEAAQISLGCGNPLAFAGLRQGETVLDIGSGGGIDVFLAARRVGPTGFVYGIDMTPAMLQRAREAADKGGYTNVKFRHGYAEKLPVEDDSIDVIISNCVINLTEDKGKVFQEAYRVLKQGGRLEVNDVVFGSPVMPEVRASAAGWAECVSGALPEQEYVDLVKQAGFKDITVRRSTSSGTAAGISFYSVQVSAKK